MTFNCPNCSAELDLEDSSCVEGIHVQCCECGSRFEYAHGEFSILNDDVVMKPKMPMVARVAISLVYILSALGFVGTAQKYPFVSIAAASFIAVINYYFQIGCNIARMLISLLVVGTWVYAGYVNTIMALWIMAIWGGPLILMWLPATNRWNSELSKYYYYRYKAEKTFTEKCNATYFPFMLFLLAAPLLCCLIGYLKTYGIGWDILLPLLIGGGLIGGIADSKQKVISGFWGVFDDPERPIGFPVKTEVHKTSHVWRRSDNNIIKCNRCGHDVSADSKTCWFCNAEIKP